MPGSTTWYRHPDTLSGLVSPPTTIIIGPHTNRSPFLTDRSSTRTCFWTTYFSNNKYVPRILRFSSITLTHIRYSLQSKMKFFIVFAALFATVAIASPTDAAAAAPADESAAIKYLLNTSPAGHMAAEDGPPPPGCYWDGTAPFCAGSCPTGYTEKERGSCGDGACCWTGYKVLCCK